MRYLTIKNGAIRTEDGQTVMLRGPCLGGWLNMENFITGFPGAESDLRRAVREELGEEQAGIFFRAFLDQFVTEDDIAFLAELGSTVVRVPFNYRHFEIHGEPDRWDERGFHYLDRTIAWAKKHGLYVIPELHAAPLWQNEGWHSDNPYGVSLLWHDEHALRRVRTLWELFAARYRDEPAVAGYNLLNEPNAPTAAPINAAYRDWTAAVRRIDKKHLIFLEGNEYSRDFTGFEEPFDALTAYSPHDYLAITHKAETYPGTIDDVFTDRTVVREKVCARSQWIIDRGRPCWVGEFGAIYDGGLAHPTPADRARLAALSDQLALFRELGAHWTIWTYKDVDVMGLVAPPADCEYLRRIEPVMALKKKLGIDAWTARGASPFAADLRAAVDKIFLEFPAGGPDPSVLRRRIVDTGFYAYTAGFLSPYFARCFTGMTAGQIERMMEEAFNFNNCRKRVYLNEVLEKAMKD